MTLIEFTDKQKELQPLLQQFGIIICPENIDHNTFIQLSWAIKVARFLYPTQCIDLYCAGLGGDLSYALALKDIINQDGNIRGIAFGEVYSSHSIIWASCSYRVIGSTSVILAHRVSLGGYITGDISDTERFRAKQLEQADRTIEKIYAAASNKKKKWWKKMLSKTNTRVFKILSAKEIVYDLEMATIWDS